MTLKDTANEDRVITITAKGAWTPGTPNYTETKSDKVNSNGKKILLDQITWTMAGCIWAPNAFVSGQNTMAIQYSGSKCKEINKNLYPLRLNDKGECGGQFKPPVGPNIPCSCDFEITDAGQTKAKGQ